MRTKALLGLAALAASAVTVMAQSNVYSLNVVGYYNLPVAANTKVMIANQLNTTNNSLSQILPGGPPGATFQKFTGGAFSGATFDDVDLAWEPGGDTITMNPGEGGFYQSPTATTLTFVGEVMQGSLVNTLPLNAKSIRSSMVPQAGTPDALGVPGEPGDTIQLFHGGAYTGATFDDVDLAWEPVDPTIQVGEAFFYIKGPASTQSQWVRNFTVQ